MRRLTLSLTLAMALTAAAASAALGAGPENPNCWGTVTAQRAVAVGDIGEHTSAQPTPHMGLRNFARFLDDLGLLAGDHPSDLGTVAAELDGIDATSCGA